MVPRCALDYSQRLARRGLVEPLERSCMELAEMESFVRAIPDFPIPGILFRDITPLLNDKRAFAAAVDMIAGAFANAGIDHVVAIEARGYILGAPVAYKLGAGFVPV